MPASNITLSEKVKKLAISIPISEDHIKNLAIEILDVCKKRGLNIAGNIVAGLDVNGPIVSCEDTNLIPFKGAIEAIDHLRSQDGLEVTLMTGWDLTTMSFFRQDRLKKLPIGIVGEYGMAYELRGKMRHLYPFDEKEAANFPYAVFKAAADDNLKVAFQGNVSTGAGAIYIEGDRNGHLLNHCLVKGRRPSAQQLYNAIKDGGSQARLEGQKIVFENKPENMKGFYTALFKTHPLISVRVKKESGDMLSITIDENDKPGFTFEDAKKFGEKAKAVTGRDVLVYEDFGLDCISPKVKEGNYSKDSGLREYAKEAFGTGDFMCAIIGDKKSDIPKNTKGVLMFAIKGSDAEKITRGMADLPTVNPNDVRDFALALSEAHRIARESKKGTKTSTQGSAGMGNAFTNLLRLSDAEKKEKGVEFTPREIYQQPDMWRKTYAIMEKNKAAIKKFMTANKNRTVLLTGAGTSAFIGLALEPLFNKISGLTAKAVPTTDIITDPDAYFQAKKKYILVHFARSGNSPESVGAFVLGEQSRADIKHIVITCNKNGKLAQMGKKKKALVILLPPETNDKSLAMTSSFSSMVIAGQYLASLKTGGYGEIVEKLAVAGKRVMDNYGDLLADICKRDFKRAVFMGSNTLAGCAKECHLKLQEESDGNVVAKHDSFMGLRHGPEAVIKNDTLVVYLMSEEKLKRKYEIDMMNGIKGKGIGQTRLAFCRRADPDVKSACDAYIEYKEEIPDEYLTPAAVLVGQMFGVLRSLSLGLKPDSPSIAGVISRVVQGVKIYDRPLFYKTGEFKVIAG